MNKILEFETLELWEKECKILGLEIRRRDGSGEDPFTHYSAYLPYTDKRVGYFGDANGADADFGIIAANEHVCTQWMGY